MGLTSVVKQVFPPLFRSHSCLLPWALPSGASRTFFCLSPQCPLWSWHTVGYVGGWQASSFPELPGLSLGPPEHSASLRAGELRVKCEWAQGAIATSPLLFRPLSGVTDWSRTGAGGDVHEARAQGGLKGNGTSVPCPEATARTQLQPAVVLSRPRRGHFTGCLREEYGSGF